MGVNHEVRVRDDELRKACDRMQGVPTHIACNLLFEGKLREAGFTLKRPTGFGTNAPEPEGHVEVYRNEMMRETIIVGLM